MPYPKIKTWGRNRLFGTYFGPIGVAVATIIIKYLKRCHAIKKRPNRTEIAEEVRKHFHIKQSYLNAILWKTVGLSLYAGKEDTIVAVERKGTGFKFYLTTKKDVAKRILENKL